jgi:hypothetical protein
LGICLLLLVSLGAMPFASAEDAPEPPVEIITILEKDVYELGETINYRIELVNRLKQPVVVWPQYYPPRVTHEAEGVIPAFYLSFQSGIQWEEVPPGGRIEIFDTKYLGGLTADVPMVLEGDYAVEGASCVSLFPAGTKSMFGRDVSKAEHAVWEAFEAEHPIPRPVYSAPVPFRLEDGEPPAMHIAARQLRAVLPEPGHLNSPYQELGSPEFSIAIAPRCEAVRLRLYVSPYIQPSRYHSVYQVEYLGQSPWGPAWAQYISAIADYWPAWRSAVTGALDIESSDKPRLAEAPDWPVELVAKLEKKEYRLDEPVRYRLELINRLNEPVIVETDHQAPRVMSETRGELQGVPPSSRQRSERQVIPPRGSIQVGEPTDLRDETFLVESGKYTVRGAVGVWLYPIEMKAEFGEPGYSDTWAKAEAFRAEHPMPPRIYSAPVTFKLRDGDPRPQDVAAKRWLDRHPEGSWLTELGAHETAGDPTVISTTIGSGLYIDLSVFHLHLGAEFAPSGKDPRYLSRTYKVKLLGKSAQWGPVWAQYDPRVDEQWPEWREAAREVFEIEPAEAPEHTP